MNNGKGYILCHIRKVKSPMKLIDQPSLKRFSEGNEDENGSVENNQDVSNILLPISKTVIPYEAVPSYKPIIMNGYNGFYNEAPAIKHDNSKEIFTRIERYFFERNPSRIKYAELYNMVSNNHFL